MFGNSEKLFTVYEKPEAAEPTERLELLREGFSLLAFVLNIFWLLYHRMWWVLLGYVVAILAIGFASQMLHFSEISRMVLQMGVQLALAFHAYDLLGWTLTRRGYRMGGVLVAESPVKAERRYYECAT